MSDHHRSTKAFLAVHKNEGTPGNLMYILIDDRATFDLIDLPEGGNDKVRSKVIDHGGQYVIFQHWLPKENAQSVERNQEHELTAKSQELGAGL
jgi:hypothetical protein